MATERRQGPFLVWWHILALLAQLSGATQHLVH